MASSTTAYLATNDGGLVYELEDADADLGRAETNDIVLTDSRSISGRHCRISVHAGRARLTDLGSMNGTFLNDARIHNACVGVNMTRAARKRNSRLTPTTRTHAPAAPPSSSRATPCGSATTRRFTASTTRDRKSVV